MAPPVKFASILIVLREKDIIKGVLTGAFFIFPPHYSVKKSIYIIKLYNMQTGNGPVRINMQKLIYGLIDYWDGKEDPYGAIYNTLAAECKKNGNSLNVVTNVVSIDVIKRAWDGNGASELAKLAIYCHYFNRMIAYGQVRQLVTRSLVAQQAHNISRSYNAINEERLRRIIRETLRRIYG